MIGVLKIDAMSLTTEHLLTVEPIELSKLKAIQTDIFNGRHDVGRYSCI